MAIAPPNVDAKLYIAAQLHASRNRVEVEASDLCCCFFCFRRFAPAKIKTWIEDSQTALCPHCGLDAVLGSASPHRFDDPFMRKMHQHHFGYRSK